MLRATILALSILLVGCDIPGRSIQYDITCDGRPIGVSTYRPTMTESGFLQVWLPDRSSIYVETEGCSFVNVKKR